MIQRKKNQPAIVGEQFKNIAKKIFEQSDLTDRKEKFNSLHSKLDELSKKMGSEDIFEDYDSKEYKDMYKEAKEYILKNKDKYMSSSSASEAEKYAKENNLSVWDTKVYDRALEYEVFDGPIGDKYQKLWKENHAENVKASKEWDKVYDQMREISKGFAEDVLGNYGKQSITGDKYYTKTVQDFLNEELSSYLEEQYRSSK